MKLVNSNKDLCQAAAQAYVYNIHDGLKNQGDRKMKKLNMFVYNICINICLNSRVLFFCQVSYFMYKYIY